MDEKNYMGKSFSILGDSISTLQGFNPAGHAVYYYPPECYKWGIFGADDVWWGRVLKKLGGKLLVNDSWSGSTVSRFPEHDENSYGYSDKRTSSLGKNGSVPDVIIVFMGVNDFIRFTIKARAETEEERRDFSVFETAYGAMLGKLKNNYPKAEIWCLNIGNADWGLEKYKRNAPGRFEEFCRIVRESAKSRGCEVFEAAEVFHGENLYTDEHPNADGMRLIAEAVLARIDRRK